MEEAVEDFGNRLKRGGVGLFYYAGHGIQVNGVNYLIPVRAKINKESDVRFKAFDLGQILAEMENANNGLNIVLLDACRDNPFARSMRSTSRGLAIISTAPEGTFISYATGPGQVAQDGDGRNSPYTGALLKNINTPGLPIEQVFKKVRVQLASQKQTPWELSSLKGEFYFRSEKINVGTTADETEPVQPVVVMAKRPSAPTVSETGRDGRYIAYSDGTVLDTKKGLFWAARDNGSNVTWMEAKSYCENYRGGGYSNWRMPTSQELASLYDPSQQNRPGARVTDLIEISTSHGWTWAAEDEGSRAAAFNFSEGRFGEGIPKSYGQYRALPVRSVK